MISANNVTLRLGKKALFEDVNIKFTEGNCYGLIGANGAGKSTFLKILSGKLETTQGEVVITPGQRLSVLEQDHFKFDEHFVTDVVIMGSPRLYEIMKEKDELYNKPDFSEEDGERAAELEGEFAELDGWEAETEVLQLLNGDICYAGLGTDPSHGIVGFNLPNLPLGILLTPTGIHALNGHFEFSHMSHSFPLPLYQIH